MTSYEELYLIANRITSAAAVGESRDIADPIQSLSDATDQIGKSFSGSWLGYHSRVYYEGLAVPPPGANFSKEWGLQELSFIDLGSRGDWREYNEDSIKKAIRSKAGNPDIGPARKASQEATKSFDNAKSEVISILETEIADNPDPFLTKLKTDCEALEAMSPFDVAQHWSPKGQYMTRDTLALGQGISIPPHIEIASEIASIRHAFGICNALAMVCNKAASHLERKKRRSAAAARIGTNVFIGHGRSAMWRELKDFVHHRLSLPWDEFNRVPVAGVTNTSRLSEMLDAAAIALLVMTAEDELADGDMQARMNVIHEAGLFQGRLGFSKAIVLLEDGCKEFSNIQGLGQIRFPKGNIGAAFEEVRRVLEREGLIPEGTN